MIKINWGTNKSSKQKSRHPGVPCKKEEMIWWSGYLPNDVIDVIINISLSVNSIRIHASVDIIFQEEVLECHHVFLLERDDHLVAQPKRHQLRRGKKTLVTRVVKQHKQTSVWVMSGITTWIVITAILMICSMSFHGFRPRAWYFSQGFMK